MGYIWRTPPQPNVRLFVFCPQIGEYKKNRRDPPSDLLNQHKEICQRLHWQKSYLEKGSSAALAGNTTPKCRTTLHLGMIQIYIYANLHESESLSFMDYKTPFYLCSPGGSSLHSAILKVHHCTIIKRDRFTIRYDLVRVSFSSQHEKQWSWQWNKYRLYILYLAGFPGADKFST